MPKKKVDKTKENKDKLVSYFDIAINEGSIVQMTIPKQKLKRKYLLFRFE